MRYLILGATEARDEQGRPVPLGGHRLRALLAALALRARSGAAVPVDALIAEVWTDPDAQPEDAPAALQALVGRLRRALGKDAVQSGTGGGYRLRAGPDDVDLHRFERLAQDGERALEAGDPATATTVLREALALWRGPALADLPERASAAARPEALRLSTVQLRIAADLELGRAAHVLPELRELVAEHPLDEPLHALRLRALRDTGRLAEALEAYESVRREIADRLGADPGVELRALHAELLASAAPRDETAPGGEAPGPGAGAGAGAGAESAGAAPDTVSVPGNLRARLTSFVGREADLDTLRGDLSRSRLVTLTGPGGSGKTRLAEQVADLLAGGATHAPGPYGGASYGGASHPGASLGTSRATAPYADGVWMVELAPLDHPAAVPGAVLSALGRRETALFSSTIEASRGGGTAHEHAAVDATARLIEHCAHRTLLLVLDNCEHVIGAAATLAETLLARCPGLVVLATSREPLGVQGETVRPVEPLPPAPAHRLFSERGVAARPGFTPDASAQDRQAVAEICRRLDGLPLAIELAAARLRSLAPRQIADRLDDRFRLLTSGSRTVLPRQQTLRAVVDWSWDLLDERERAVLRRISVFAGGCTLSAAEYVCAGPGTVAADPPDASGSDTPDGTYGPDSAYAPDVPEHAVLDVLSALVDKSILTTDRPASAVHTGVRYRLLETIHEYARERAAEHPAELAAAEARHTEQIVRFVTAAEPRLRSTEQLAWFPRVESDLDNIRAVLHRVLQARDRERAVALVLAMGWFWWLRNYRDEGGEWISHTLDLLPGDLADCDPAEEMQCLELQMLRLFLLYEQQDRKTLMELDVRPATNRILDIFRRPVPESTRFPGLLWPFTVYMDRAVSEESRPSSLGSLMDASVANCRAFGGTWELAVVLLFRAHIHVDLPFSLVRGAFDLPEIDALAQATGDRWLISQVSGLHAEIETMRGAYDEARRRYETALRHAQALGAQTEIPFLLARIAETWYRQGDVGEAERLAERAMEDAERLNVVDAQAYSTFLRGWICLERGDTARARALCGQTADLATRGTPPAVFHLVLSAQAARVTAAEGVRPLEAVREMRDTLRTADDCQMPETLTATLLLSAAIAVLAAGHPRTAVRLADGAVEARGELPASVPELREDGRIRATAGGQPVDGPAPSPAEAAELLGALLTDATSAAGDLGVRPVG